MSKNDTLVMLDFIKINKQKVKIKLEGQRGSFHALLWQLSPTGRGKTLLFWQGLNQWRAMDSLFSTTSSLLSPLCRRVPLPLPDGDLSWLQALNFNSLLIPKKLIFAAEISGSLFVLGQQKVHPEWVPLGLALGSIYHRNRSASSTFPHPPTHR